MEKILDKAASVEVSADGTWLYYAINGLSTTLWRKPVRGGEPETVIPSIPSGQRFAVSRSGIWYTTSVRDGSLLQFYDFASKSSRMVYHATRAFYSGLAISPDQRRILFSRIDRPQNHDLVMVEQFK